LKVSLYSKHCKKQSGAPNILVDGNLLQ